MYMGKKFSELKGKKIRGNFLSLFRTKEKNSVEMKSETAPLHNEKITDTPLNEENVADASPNEEKVADASLNEEKIADASLNEEKIADASLNEEKIAGKTVDEGKSADDNKLDVTTLVSMATPVLGAKVKVFIVFYSMYGHVLTLAKKVKEGVDSVEGVEAFLYQVPETLSAEVLTMMKAPPKDDSIPTITAAQLSEADAFLFGIPTRFGAMAAQMKAFFDSTGSLWKTQALAGKPAGIFVSTGSQGGGQETTALTSITQLTHHGMLYVPIGYTFGPEMFPFEEVRGGSPYGAGTYAGSGSRMPSERELAIALHQGKYTANIAKVLAKSKSK